MSTQEPHDPSEVHPLADAAGAGARCPSGPLVVNGRFLRATPTGLHRVARSLVRALRAQGADIVVLAPAGVVDPLVDRTTWAPPGRLGDHIWEQVLLPTLARDRPVLSLANTAPLAARRSVVMVHDLATLVGPQWFRPELRIYGRLSLLAARRAEAVVCPSRQVAGELVDAGVAAARVHVVPNGVDPGLGPADPDAVGAVRAAFALDRPYLLHVGWADPRKDVWLAIRAHRQVRSQRPHDLVLVGGSHRNFPPVPVPEDPSVRRVGRVSDATLRALLTGAAALVYPSCYEGFGLPPVEALACGTPALVSDLPAVREACGGSATFLPPGDVSAWAAAMAAALDGQLRSGPPPGRTWDAMATELLAVLSALPPGRRRHQAAPTWLRPGTSRRQGRP